MATTRTHESGIGRLTQHSSPEIWLHFGRYRARLAETDDDRTAIYRLRFLVFNLELNEGSALLAGKTCLPSGMLR